MPSYYWFKLYDEILDDPKMGRLPDRLYRRSIEMMAFANRFNQEGKLPPVSDMAWVLRCDESELLAEMEELANERYRILTRVGNDWIVTQFLSRQERVSDAERKRRQRERDRQENYYGHDDDTETDNSGHDDDTKRDIDIESESEIERELESEREQRSAREAEKEPKYVDLESDQAEEYDDRDGDDDFTRLQHALEQVIGLPIVPGDIPPIQEMIKLGVTRADIQGAAEWMAANGKTIRYAGQLYGPVRVQVAKRKQEGLAGSDPPGKGGGAARKNGNLAGIEALKAELKAKTEET